MSERIFELLINDQGDLLYIHDDDLTFMFAELGKPLTKRASHVEPDPNNPGMWLADMSPTAGFPCTLGPFPTRREALAEEVQWLKEVLFPSKEEVSEKLPISTGV